MNKSEVWYVTGASQGLGLILVKKLLAGGYRVVAWQRMENKQVIPIKLLKYL